MSKAPDQDTPVVATGSGPSVNLTANKPGITPLSQRSFSPGGSQQRMEARTFSSTPLTTTSQSNNNTSDLILSMLRNGMN